MSTDPAILNAVEGIYSGAGASLNPDKSPDDAARAFELSAASGVPAQSILQDLPTFENAHKKQLGQQIIDNNDDIASFINAHPAHGQLIHDDLGSLDEYSRAYRHLTDTTSSWEYFKQEKAQSAEDMRRRPEGYQATLEEKLRRASHNIQTGVNILQGDEVAPTTPAMRGEWSPGIGTRPFFGPQDRTATNQIIYALADIASGMIGTTIAPGTAAVREYITKPLERYTGIPAEKLEGLALALSPLIKPTIGAVRGALPKPPLEGEVLPPEPKPLGPEPGGLPRPGETIEGEAGPTDMSRRGFLQGAAALAASTAAPGGLVGKALEAATKSRLVDPQTPYAIARQTLYGLHEDVGQAADHLLDLAGDAFKRDPDSLVGRVNTTASELICSGQITSSGINVEAIANAIRQQINTARPFLEAGRRPPPGVSDAIDEIEAQHTELSSKATDEVIASRDNTALSQRSPEKLEEFTSALPKGTTRIAVDAFTKVPPDKFDWIPDLEQRLASGATSITVPTNTYISRVEKEIHDEIKEFVSHGEDLSPAEVKELKENKVPSEGIDTLQTIRDGAGFNPPPPEEPPKPPEGTPPEKPKRIFSKAKAFGRTEREYTAYEELIAQRDAEDVEWRLSRAKAQAERENSQAWKDEARSIRSEVRDEISSRPEIAAYRFFQDGEAFGNKLARRPKINEQSLTPEQKASFPKQFIAPRGRGYDPDAVANLFGFSDGDTLIAAVSSLEREATAGRGDIVDRLVDAEVNRRVDAKLGESAKERLDEAYDHALSVTQMELIHERMLQLGTQVGTAIEIPPMRSEERR